MNGLVKNRPILPKKALPKSQFGLQWPGSSTGHFHCLAGGSYLLLSEAFSEPVR